MSDNRLTREIRGVAAAPQVETEPPFLQKIWALYLQTITHYLIKELVPLGLQSCDQPLIWSEQTLAASTLVVPLSAPSEDEFAHWWLVSPNSVNIDLSSLREKDRLALHRWFQKHAPQQITET